MGSAASGRGGLPAETVAQWIRLYRSGFTAWRISRELGIDESTSRKYAAKFKRGELTLQGRRCGGCGGFVVSKTCQYCLTKTFLKARRELGLDC
jgi:hypothetical protein